MNETPQPLRVRATTTCEAAVMRSQCPLQFARIVPVDLQGRQPERPEFFRQRLQVGDFPRRAESLKTVEVDQEGQVLEPMMLGEDQGLPARALIPLTVGRQTEYPAGLSFEPLGQGEPGRQRKPMPQAPRCEQDVLDARGRRMTAEPRAVLVERAQVLLGQLAERPERDIVGPGGVPLRKDELIRWTEERGGAGSA